MDVKLTLAAYEKLMGYVDQCEYEIGGLGKIQVNADGKGFLVTDVEIFDQVVTATHVQLTAETLAKFQAKKIKAKESIKEYCFWWHSHAKMDAFFSGTDTGTIDESTEFPWLVSLVTNHAHKMVARFDVYSPVHLTQTLTVSREDTRDKKIRAACFADIKKHVTMPAKVATPTWTERDRALGEAGRGWKGEGYLGYTKSGGLDTRSDSERGVGSLLPYQGRLDDEGRGAGFRSSKELSEDARRRIDAINNLKKRRERIEDSLRKESKKHGDGTKKHARMEEAWYEIDAQIELLENALIEDAYGR